MMKIYCYQEEQTYVTWRKIDKTKYHNAKHNHSARARMTNIFLSYIYVYAYMYMTWNKKLEYFYEKRANSERRKGDCITFERITVHPNG